MLRRIRIKNFKLLRDVTLEFPKAATPTVLIGTNASGKSTVIEVLDFLSRCATDGLNGALVAHGGMNAVRTIGAKGPIEIESHWEFRVELVETDWDLTWRFAIDAGPSGVPRLVAESLTDGGRGLVSTDEAGVRTVVDESEEGSQQLRDAANFAFEKHVDELRYSGLFWLRIVLSRLRVIGAFATAPAWASVATNRLSPRDPVVISTEAFVGREGVGLANALYNLHTEHADAWALLERALRAEFPFVKRIVFPPDPGGSKISFAIEDQRFSGRKIYASEMSDGMVVYLCLLALIVQPNQIGVLALDEPDAHLHPSAVRRLLAIAASPSLRRNLIIVTHSNALLDELRDPVASIRIVESTPEGARIRQLDPAALAAWRKDYTLSEMRRAGLLDPSNSSYGDEP
ncbi:MAG: AAA family ATPase [Kofleriaceae bacterium]|nr:AAA family ATPase [Kofleriaceae bacterium]MBP9172710.1 AAA family ATPase [Kofleriaceae bacterium]MBP9859800.1 AAA family ATPase [Kofleriaceae bacterium]